MTGSEYQELTEFLGKKFDAIDRRFDQSDQKTDVRFASLEERLSRVELGNEQNAHQIQVLAEGITAVDQKLDRFKEEVTGEFRSVRGEMAEGFAAVRGEMAEGFRAQGDRIDGLGRRMDRSLRPKRN